MLKTGGSQTGQELPEDSLRTGRKDCFEDISSILTELWNATVPRDRSMVLGITEEIDHTATLSTRYR